MSELVEHFGRFAQLFPEPILLVSSSGHLCAANAGARKTLFADAAWEEDRLLFDYIEDEPEAVLPYLRACSRTADPLPGVLCFRGAHGVTRAYRTHGSAFKDYDQNGRPLVILRLSPKDASTARFLTLNQQIDRLRQEVGRRIRAEQASEQQRELLQVTLSSIGDAVIATDVAGRVTFMNPVAEALTGWAQVEAAGRALDDVFVIRNEYTGAPVESPVDKVLSTGQIVGLANHTVLIRRDGTQMPIDDSGAPIRDRDGQLLGVILVFHEIAENRRLERELLKQTEALREADRKKDQFLAVLAHELRNPLAPLRNGLQIARLKAKSDSGLAGTFQMMERQLLHLIRLVNDLMDVSRVSRGAIELKRAPVFIADVISRSIESVRADILARGHRLEVDLDDGGCVVDGDADRLAQVFSNLLANSSKYSPDGALIRVTAAREGACIVVRVIDTGIGIPPEHLENVFEMFSQVRHHQARSEGGLGIGLSLVRTLVEMHDGSIEAHSQGHGTGSTFTVRLPVRSAGESAQPPPEAQPDLPTTRMRIVVADDNADAAGSLKMLLEMMGHTVHLAANGREAVEHVQELRPDVIFMDIGMPVMDGVEATRRIRNSAWGQSIVIAAVTGWGQPEDRERTRMAGVDCHVVKPISPSDIVELLTLVAARKGS